MWRTDSYSLSKFGWQTLKNIISIIILFILSVYVVYFIGQSFSKIFFLVLLLLFLLSKRDYFWFAFFFILAQGPGNFFADFSGTSQYRLPSYTFLSGFSFNPLDFFVILAFLKAILKGKRTKLKLKRPLILILIYIIFSFVITSFIFGTNADILAWNLRWLFYYSIIISFSYLVTKKDEVYHFILLVFPFVFFILFTQIYYIRASNEFINLFDPGFRGIVLNTVTGELRPDIGGVLLVFFSFIFALFLLQNKDFRLSKVYLYLIITTSFFSIFISATRLWSVIFSFILMGYILVSKRKILSVVGIAGSLFVILSVLSCLGLTPSDLLLGSAWKRVSQVSYIAKGNIYIVDTARSRFFDQLPIILEQIKQNPLTGYGVSEITMEYCNNNLGFVNTILMFGIFGLSLFIYFFIKYFSMISTSIKRFDNNPFKNSLKIMAIVWVGILIGYFSTWDFFTYYFYKTFFISILIAITEFFIREAEELSMSRQIPTLSELMISQTGK